MHGAIISENHPWQSHGLQQLENTLHVIKYIHKK